MADAMELNFFLDRHRSSKSGSYDDSDGRWGRDEDGLRRADGTHGARCGPSAHIVMATGVSGIPKCSGHSRSRQFQRARSCIPSQYDDGRTVERQARALVIGTGNKRP